MDDLREFELVIDQAFLDILARAGSNLLPLDYEVGQRVLVTVQELVLEVPMHPFDDIPSYRVKEVLGAGKDNQDGSQV